VVTCVRPAIVAMDLSQWCLIKDRMKERERILDRLTKLLALAGSPNSHEAATAKKMAESLMKKHKLTRADVSAYAPAGLYERPMGSKGFEHVWKFSLITATARFCGCEAISLLVGKRRKVRLVGERENVDRAAELFLSLLRSLTELEKIEAAWISDPSVLIYSQPQDYALSFRQGATVAIIELMQRMRPARFGLRRRKDSGSSPEAFWTAPSPASPVPSPASAVSPSTETVEETATRASWISKIWPWGKRPVLAAVEKQPEQALVVVIAKKSGKGEEGGEDEYKAKVKSKYAPRQVRLHLEDAVDEGAYWRGYESVRLRLVLPNDDSSHSASHVDGSRKSTG